MTIILIVFGIIVLISVATFIQLTMTNKNKEEIVLEGSAN